MNRERMAGIRNTSYEAEGQLATLTNQGWRLHSEDATLELEKRAPWRTIGLGSLDNGCVARSLSLDLTQACLVYILDKMTIKEAVPLTQTNCFC